MRGDHLPAEIGEAHPRLALTADQLAAAHLELEVHGGEVATSLRASQLRTQRVPVVGMQKDDVIVLLEQPDTVTSDQAAMRAAAGRFWPPIEKHAKEMWTYPNGWQLYFDGDQLADVIVAGHSPLE